MADSDGKDGNFFGRWSQRKVQARHEDLPAGEPAEPTKPAEPAKSAAKVSQAPVGSPVAATGNGLKSDAITQPTLEDVAKLTVDSDYSSFAARNVDS